MQITKNIRASEKQEQVTRYGNEAHILLGEREVEIDNGDGTASLQYEYDKVIIEDATQYADVVQATTLFYNKVKKEESLNSIITPTRKFYGDGMSRVDLLTLLVLKLSDSIVNEELIPTAWKLEVGITNDVTFGDVKTAIYESLEEKGKIVGVTDATV